MAAAGSERRPIVVGVDGSEHAARALRWALDEARIRGAAVQETLDQAVDDQATGGVEVERSLVRGPAAQALLDAAKGADLRGAGADSPASSSVRSASSARTTRRVPS